METLRRIIDSDWFQRTIIGLIVLNGIALGLETVPAVNMPYHDILVAIDYTILWIFVAELAARLIVHRQRFFNDAWNWFDFIVVGISLVPAQEAFSVLRALRVLRVLRLVSALPQLRNVVQGLMRAIPGLASIMLIMMLVFYVFAVIAVKLFGRDFPELFGSFTASLFTLFQIMTLEGWADIVREIMKTHPYAWVYFVIYILVSTFTVLNLFIAVIVEGMAADTKKLIDDDIKAEQDIHAELSALRADVAELRKDLAKPGPRRRPRTAPASAR